MENLTKCYEIEVEEEKLNIPEEAKSENTFIMHLYDEVKIDIVSDENVDFSKTPETAYYIVIKKDTNSTYSSLFAAYERNMNTFKSSTSCTNKQDGFTVNNTNGNVMLNYPVGLLAADEYTMAGSGNIGYSINAYLYTGESQWTMSAARFSGDYARNFTLTSSKDIDNNYVNKANGVRPSISLKAEIDYVTGTGTVNDPYIVSE